MVVMEMAFFELKSPEAYLLEVAKGDAVVPYP